MAEERYKTPGSDVLVPGQNYYICSMCSRSMLIAIAIHLVLGVVLVIIPGKSDISFDAVNWVLGAFLDVAWTFFLVVLIRKVREFRVYRIMPKLLGVWGYFWRTLVAKCLAILLATMLLVIFSVSENMEIPSIGYTVVSMCLSIFLSVACVWALYSFSRKEQVNWFVGIFRGY